MLNILRVNFQQSLKLTNETYKRYMFKNIDFNNKLIGIIGARGVGKTTFLLQYLKELKIPFDKKLYFSADHIDMASYSLYEVAKAFSQKGGELLVIDEIHKYSGFEQELKSIYDTLDLKVIFSGSSALALENSKADLSRRAVLYRVNGLSFREFCELETGLNLPSYSLDEIVENHINIAFEINNQLKPFAFFENYLHYGFYPFYRENLNSYKQKLNETINLVVETDLPYIFNIEPKNIHKLKKLIVLLCQSKPYELNISKLAQKIEINRNTLYNYIHCLEMGSIVKSIKSKSKGDNIFSKPEKLYLHNSNLSYAYCSQQEIGTIRELFVANQLSLLHEVTYPKWGDFLVDNHYTFEVGGKNKSFKQLKGIENSFVIADSIEIGESNKIPLWLFGFFY